MRILVSGATGLIGSALSRLLEEQGHTVIALTRRTDYPGEHVHWNPDERKIEKEKLAGIEAVVHLAGDPVAGGGRWTAEKKRRIRDSRVEGTKLLVSALLEQQTPPGVLVSGSAIGYYGDRGDEELTEESPPGEGFLAEVCVEWEAAARAMESAGTRVVLARTGIVLSKHGGALRQMLTPFRLGIGGRLGSGKHFMSWITNDDTARAMAFCLEQGTIAGPVNVVSPSPVRNAEFTKVLAGVLHRPAFLPLPAWWLRILFGEVADEMLLASARVVPTRLAGAGFEWRHPELRAALEHVIRNPNAA